MNEKNPLYSDIEIDKTRIPSWHTNLFDVEQSEPLENNDELKEVKNPLNVHRFTLNEGMMLSNASQPQDISIPGEDETPISMINEQFCQELAHPDLFRTGKFGYKVKRDLKLSPTKYFNQRLLNQKQHFASDSDYISYALSTL